MRGQAFLAVDGAKGFDCNVPLTEDDIAAFLAAGYTFVCRYVGREAMASNDLTPSEVGRCLERGLNVMAVQHVKSAATWVPTADKGALWGANAARFAYEAGVAPGTTLWCDLEGVDPTVPADVVRAYCAAWYAAVAVAGYKPGLYVGWHCGLSPLELYTLPFQHYWGAYNLDKDQEPATRGIQMKQHEISSSDRPRDVTIEFDKNTIERDQLGGLPVWHTA